jgi:hypothetical protein
MPRKTETPAVDWRAAAEETGRLAFEAATAGPQPTPEAALAWLWKTSTREEESQWRKRRKTRNP